jgi:hypothetical protein
MQAANDADNDRRENDQLRKQLSDAAAEISSLRRDAEGEQRSAMEQQKSSRLGMQNKCE